MLLRKSKPSQYSNMALIARNEKLIEILHSVLWLIKIFLALSKQRRVYEHASSDLLPHSDSDSAATWHGGELHQTKPCGHAGPP